MESSDALGSLIASAIAAPTASSLPPGVSIKQIGWPAAGSVDTALS